MTISKRNGRSGRASLKQQHSSRCSGSGAGCRLRHRASRGRGGRPSPLPADWKRSSSPRRAARRTCNRRPSQSRPSIRKSWQNSRRAPWPMSRCSCRIFRETNQWLQCRILRDARSRNTDIIVYNEAPVAVLIDDFVMPEHADSAPRSLRCSGDRGSARTARYSVRQEHHGRRRRRENKAPVLDEFTMERKPEAAATTNTTAQGAINIPIISNQLALRLVASEEHQDGWMRKRASNTSRHGLHRNRRTRRRPPTSSPAEPSSCGSLRMT